MEAKKAVENKREGEYQIIKFHVINIPDDKIPIEWICDKLNLLDFDGEDAYFKFGLCFNPDGEVDSIVVNKFISGIEERLEENDDYWELDKEDHEKITEELIKLKKYKDYDIWL